MRNNLGLDMATEIEARAAAIITDLDAGACPSPHAHRDPAWYWYKQWRAERDAEQEQYWAEEDTKTTE